MKQLKPVFQKPGKDKAWKDESGVAIPSNRISRLEKVKESSAQKVFTAATKVSSALVSLYDLIKTANEEVSKAVDAEHKALDKKAKVTKGNFTWYNFDRSVKIEVNIQETIKFDEAMIAAARERFDQFIAKNVQGTDDIVRQLINSAFANTKNGLDTKKVMSLMKYRSKIRDKQFQQALDLIQGSISRPTSKRYFRVWAKDEDNQYKNIELNFSSL